MMAFHHAVRYGKDEIEFGVAYVKRQTLEIAVHPDGAVRVKAPLGTQMDEVRRRVVKRAGWIRKQIRFFRQFDPRTPVRKYVGGESHLYLGKQYRLKISSGKTNGVKLRHGFFWVRIKGRVDPVKVRKLMEAWYLEKAVNHFRESLDRQWPFFKKSSGEKPVLSIRRMKTRWGSLSTKGTLTLNVDLIRAPKECIDYVIAHELCHLKYADHGKRFHELLGKVMADWEKRKYKLEAMLK